MKKSQSVEPSHSNLLIDRLLDQFVEPIQVVRFRRWLQEDP